MVELRQGGIGNVGIKTNKQAIARKFGVKSSEVTYAVVGTSLAGYKVIYDKNNQRSYSLPAGLTSSDLVVSLVDGLLTHTNGTIDLAALAVQRGQFVTLNENFTTGATIKEANEVISDGKDLWYWDGTLPKSIPKDSNLLSSGGVGKTFWLPAIQTTIRSNIVLTAKTIDDVENIPLVNGQIVYIQGRTTAFDGGGGFFRYDSVNSLTVDGGIIFKPTNLDGYLVRVIRTNNSENQLSESINVRWFGAKGDAKTDDTAAVLAAYNFAKSTNLFYTLLFPAGRYVTRSSFIFQDVTAATFKMDGCVFIGASTGSDNSQQAVFEIRNAVNLSISGPFSITQIPNSGPISDNNPNAYISAFFARGVPGGVLQPALGIVAFLSVHDMTSIRVGNAIRIGEINNDAQMSEMQFVNCKTPFTVNPVQVAGSQAIVSFVGCTLASNEVSGITNAPNATIVNDGGAVTVTGGSVEQHSNTGTQMVLMRPCSSTLYGNPYGQVTITGSCIETIAPLCQIANPNSFSNPASYLSRFSIVGCVGGFIGAIPISSPTVSVFDTSYSGVVNIPDGTSFYSTVGAPSRTSPNVDASGNNKVRIIVGKTSFDTSTGFRSYQAGISGGVMIHPELMATAANVTSQEIPSGSSTVIVWGGNPTDNTRMGRYHYIVNTSNGGITVPDAGVKSMKFEASVVLDAASTTGNIGLYRNNILYKFGVIGGGVGILDASIPDPVPGEVITVKLTLSAASALTNSTKLNVFITT